jgi:glutamine cyclotransferase
MYGESKLKRSRLSTGEVLQVVSLPKSYFGEGAVAFNNFVYQLTYRERVVRKYDSATFQLLGELPLPSQIREGWGMTRDDSVIYVTDGSHRIYVINPVTFTVLGTISVTEGDGTRVTNLNELEVINGEIWANIYYSWRVARIDPATGVVNSYVDLTGLAAEDEHFSWWAGEVLNGIAVNDGKVLVTGKNWSHIYAIEVN